MTSKQERTWTAHIVIAFDDQYLNRHGRALEDEMRVVFARVDNPDDAADYAIALREASAGWYRAYRNSNRDK